MGVYFYFEMKNMLEAKYDVVSMQELNFHSYKGNQTIDMKEQKFLPVLEVLAPLNGKNIT